MTSFDHNCIVASGAPLVVPMADVKNLKVKITVNMGTQYLDQSFMESDPLNVVVGNSFFLK